MTMAKKVSKKVTSKKTLEKVDTKKVSSSDELEEGPSFFHYVVVLGALILFGFIIFWSFEIHERYSSPDLSDVLVEDEKYVYKYVRGNVTYNLELGSSLDDIRKLGYDIEPNRMDILNSINFIFSFDIYNGSDNGYVSTSAIKLKRFLDTVYFFHFDQEDFSILDEISCLNSTRNNRVVIFDINSTRNGVFEDSNYCLKFEAMSPQELNSVIDSFMIAIVEDE